MLSLPFHLPTTLPPKFLYIYIFFFLNHWRRIAHITSLCLIIFQYECPKDKNILTCTHTMAINFNTSNRGFPGSASGKDLPANAGDIKDSDLIPGWKRSPGGKHGNIFQYFSLENPMEGGTWGITVHSVRRSQTGLKQLSIHAYWTSTLVYNSYSSSVNYPNSVLQSKYFSSSVCQLESHIAVHYLFSSMAFLCFCTICLCAIFWRIQASNFRELVSLNFRFLWCFLLIRFWL